MRKHKFKYCTYTHSINGIVFYVGCGTYNRPYQKGRKGKDRSYAWFEIAESVDYKYDINIILESDSREDCLKKEIELTIYYKNIGQAIANEKIGDNLSERHKKRISETAITRTGINNPFYGKHHTEVAREKIRQANIGRKDGEETNRKKGLKDESHPKHKECIVVFDDGNIKQYLTIKALVKDIRCLNASAYARGVLGSPKHYWKQGKCYIYYKKYYDENV